MSKGDTSRLAKKQERRIAKLLGGSRRGRSNQLWTRDAVFKQTVQIGPSGNTVIAPHSKKSLKAISPAKGTKTDSADTRTTDKGDIRIPSMHVEHKFTGNKSISITREWLDKVSDGARQQGLDPALVFTFIDLNKTTEDWAVIPLELLIALLAKGN